MTAHPKICPTTGEMHFFGYGNIFEPHVTYHRADANGELTINRPVDVTALTMMHDFAMTADHVVFMDLPIVFNLDIAIERRTRHAVPLGRRLRRPLRRAAPRRPVRRGPLVRHRPVLRLPRRQRIRRRRNSIVLQAVRYPELWRNNGGFDADGVLWSWTIDLATGTVDERQLDDRAVEFPRIDDRLAGLPARYAVVGRRTNGLVRYDLTDRCGRRASLRHRGIPGGPGEAVFVPSATGPADESNGWYIGYVYDPARDGSDLVILDASDFARHAGGENQAAATCSVRLPRQLDHRLTATSTAVRISGCPDGGQMAGRTRRPRLRRGGGLSEHAREPDAVDKTVAALQGGETGVPQGEGHPARRELALLPENNTHVRADLAKISDGKRLSPILLVRGNAVTAVPLQIADGYHRVCASYLTDENTAIPCRLVSWQILSADMSRVRLPHAGAARRHRPGRPAAGLAAAASGYRWWSANWSPGSSSAEPVSASSTTTDPTFTLLANIGFALVMFVVGTHVPVRDKALRSAIPKALLRAVAVGAVAAVLGVVLAELFGTGHAALYAVLMASSSAALALPVIDSLGLTGPPVLSVTAQIAIADAASIVLLPLVIDPTQAPRAALGALAIAGCAAVLFVVLRLRRPQRLAQAAAPLLRGPRVGARTADQPDPVVRACALGDHHARVDHAGGIRAGPGGLGGRRTAPAGPPAVRHHRGLLRPAVLRLAGRVAAGARTR